MLSFQPLSLLIHQQRWVQHRQFLLYKHFTWFSEPIPSLTSPPLPFRVHSLLTLRRLWLCVCDLLCWSRLSTWLLITGVTSAQIWEFSPSIYLYILTLMAVSYALNHVCMLRTSASTSPSGLFQNSGPLRLIPDSSCPLGYPSALLWPDTSQTESCCPPPPIMTFPHSVIQLYPSGFLGAWGLSRTHYLSRISSLIFHGALALPLSVFLVGFSFSTPN